MLDLRNFIDKSHRAKIPAMIMSKIKLGGNSDNVAQRKYNFNAKNGVFTEYIESDFAYIEHQLYLHAKYIRLFVSTIKMKRRSINGAAGGGKLRFNYPALNTTNDFDRVSSENFDGANLKHVLRTKESEDGKLRELTIYMHDPPTDLTMGIDQEKVEVVLMSMDKDGSAAYNEFNQGYKLAVQGRREKRDILLEQHIEYWDKIWNEGHVEVEGSPIIEKLVNFAQYYLYSSLPPINVKLSF